jgi:hypothetical protein
MKFICEFIIDSYDQDEKPDIILMRTILMELVKMDQESKLI